MLKTEKKPTAGLYLVATPIGNLGDMSPRAVETLKEADIVYCEDTRNTAKLFSLLGISAPLQSYHDHNAGRVRPKILSDIEEGRMVALVSDAGMPLISDPGYKLVREARDRGFYVTSVPGASAVLTALQLSGLPTNRFLFMGFLPPKTGARRKELEKVKNLEVTLVIFETASKLSASLKDMAGVLGDRNAALVRELTKKFEETVSGTLVELAARFEETPPKGEIVLVVEGAKEREETDETDVLSALLIALETKSVKEAAAEIADVYGKPRKEIYALALANKDKKRNV